MRIGIDAREFRSERMTGIGRYLLQFLQHALEKEEHEYILFCNQHTYIPLEHARLRKVFIREYLTALWDQVFLPIYVMVEKADVFLTPYFKAPFFLSCPMVLIINDVIPLLFPEEHSFKTRLYFEIMNAISARRAKKIIAISENSKADIVKFFKVPAYKIDVVYLGVGEEFKYDISKSGEVREKYGLPEKYIFYVGNMGPHKNIINLLSSYAGLPVNLRQQYKLVIGAGKKDKYCPQIKNMIEKLGLEEDVVITGFIREEHLPAVYSASSVFAFPSLYEGFGLPVVEAMACGVPVLTSNLSSIPEIAKGSALLGNPYDTQEITSAMARLLEDADLRKTLTAKSLDNAKKFTPENMTDNILSVLKKAVERRR